jgi:SpoVK/Ycf46/Vps4 family AAA+-type ATPase
MDGFVGADIAGLCRLAALASLARHGTDAEAASLVVEKADFSAALRQHTEGRPWLTT